MCTCASRGLPPAVTAPPARQGLPSADDRQQLPPNTPLPPPPQGFDFNTCIAQGIPYLPVRQRDSIIAQVRPVLLKRPVTT